MTSETETYKRMSNENISSANNDHIDNKELGDRSAQSSATSAEVDLEYGTEKERGQDEAPRDGQSAPVGPSGPPAGHPPGALPAPPDGGMKAWLQVIGGYCLFFNTWGLLNTFGVYQTYYETGKLFHASSSDIAWIGSIQAFCLLFIGFLSGPLFDRGYLRALLIVGSFSIVFGHMMLSLCHTFWQVLLAQGFVIGLGSGCLFVPSVAILPPYFKTKLGLVLGLATSGSSMGGIIYPIMFYRLIDEVGFRWSVRILGFTALATLILPVVVMQQRFKPQQARALLDLTTFTDLHFMIFSFGTLVGFTGVYVAVFYLSYCGLARGLTDPSLSFYLVAIFNAGSVVGRIVPNWASDKIGPFNVIVPGAVVSGILMLCLLAVNSAGGIIAIAVLLGISTGIFIALPGVLFNALSPDKSKVGTRIGMGFAFFSPAVFLGGPAAGAILGDGTANLHWSRMWIYGGVMLLAASIPFLYLRMARAGWKIKAKL